MAQLVKCLTLSFSSDHDLMVHGFKPLISLHVDGLEPAWDSLSLFFPDPPLLSLSLSKINKLKKIKESKMKTSI